MKKYISLFILSWLLVYNAQAKPIYPKRLQVGDTVGLISSGSYVPRQQDIVFARKRIEKLGLHVVMGNSVDKHYGYFAGTVKERVNDINRMFGDKKIKAIFEVRGGWGSAQLLRHLDYQLIKRNPKIFIGFSDITSLLLAIHKKTGLVTFHGPLAIEPWPHFTVSFLRKTLFESSAVTYSNPVHPPSLNKDIIQTEWVTQVVQPGRATGELIGGNLSVLVSLLGTPYEPNWNNKILFVEDVGMNNYQIERLLVQLDQAKVFKKIKGFIFGECTHCVISDNALGGFSLYTLVKRYIQPYHIPAFIGAAIGHEPQNFTIPIGGIASMDANRGSIKLLHPAVR